MTDAAGFDDEETLELFRLYQTIHTDHEVSPALHSSEDARDGCHQLHYTDSDKHIMALHAHGMTTIGIGQPSPEHQCVILSALQMIHTSTPFLPLLSFPDLAWLCREAT